MLPLSRKPDGLAVLRDRDAGEVPRLFRSLSSSCGHFRAASPAASSCIGQLRPPTRPNQRADTGRRAHRTDLHGHLSAHQRRDAAERVQQPFVERLALRASLAKQRANRLRRLRRKFPVYPAAAADGSRARAGPAARRTSQSQRGAGSRGSVPSPPVRMRFELRPMISKIRCFCAGRAHLVGAVERQVDEPLHSRLA